MKFIPDNSKKRLEIFAKVKQTMGDLELQKYLIKSEIVVDVSDKFKSKVRHILNNTKQYKKSE